jgi:UDP-N-acetylglucosamine--N-acetylmuramyl-(pentapeptide) pyrophosphoryl-undecaprenol N-acetylglucosamine transferase
MERVILTTGGTGGHIFPALAVAEEIRARRPATRILFVGGRRGPEAAWAGRAGLEFASLAVQPVLGRGVKVVTALWSLGLGVLGAMRILKKFDPDVVLGFGGYAAFATGMAGALLRVKTAIHEQNSVPGLTNRVLGRYAKRVFLSFPDKMKRFDPDKVLLTGNPVRAAIRTLGEEAATQEQAQPRRVLVVGGSQGARAINDAILEALPRLAAAKVELRHQTGKADLERVRAAYQAAGLDPLCVNSFIDDMAGAYRWADLLVCRAGATTIAEVTVAGKPCLFVPYPYASHNHQVENARYMEQAGAALCIEQREFSTKNLGDAILGLLKQPETLRSMAEAAKKQGKPYAATVLVAQLEKLAEGHRRINKEDAKWIKE